MKNKQSITESIDKLFEQAPYFSITALRKELPEYKPDTVKTYLSRQQREGKIFDAGRGCYSSLPEPYQLDTVPVEKLVCELKTAFPLLGFACWSTAQLNDMLRHQQAKHVQFAYVERDAINSVTDWLRSNGYRTWANPGKQERQTFSIEENTVVVLPLVSKSPSGGGFAAIGKLLVDVLADTSRFSIINIPEFIVGSKSTISMQRIDISELISYAERRKVDISEMEKGLIIY